MLLSIEFYDGKNYMDSQWQRVVAASQTNGSSGKFVREGAQELSEGH
jgi:hypothetical protein